MSCGWPSCALPDGWSGTRALVFNALYCVARLVGSALQGVVSGYSIGAVVVISVVATAADAAVLYRLAKG